MSHTVRNYGDETNDKDNSGGDYVPANVS
jgi:hypothetical protein